MRQGKCAVVVMMMVGVGWWTGYGGGVGVHTLLKVR